MSAPVQETTWSQVIQKSGKQEKTGVLPTKQEVKDLTASSDSVSECGDCAAWKESLQNTNHQMTLLQQQLEQAQEIIESLTLRCEASEKKVAEFESILAFPKVNSEGFSWKDYHSKHANFVPEEKKYHQLSRKMGLEYEESLKAQKRAWDTPTSTRIEEKIHKESQPELFGTRHDSYKKLKEDYKEQRATIETLSEELHNMYLQIDATESSRVNGLTITTSEIVKRAKNTQTQQNYHDDFIQGRSRLTSSTYSNGTVTWDPNSYLKTKKALLEEKEKQKKPETT